MDIKKSLQRLKMLKNEINDIISNLEAGYPDQEEEVLDVESEESMEEPAEEEFTGPAEESPDDESAEDVDDEEKNLRLQSISAILAKKLKR
jgi:hypothetical protein